MYFKLRAVDIHWLTAEIRKGNIFYDHHNGYQGIAGRGYKTCAAVRHNGTSYDDMNVHEVIRLIIRYRNVYWRN